MPLPRLIGLGVLQADRVTLFRMESLLTIRPGTPQYSAAIFNIFFWASSAGVAFEGSKFARLLFFFFFFWRFVGDEYIEASGAVVREHKPSYPFLNIRSHHT